MYKITDEIARIAVNMYRLGWDERNGGNISCIVDDKDIAECAGEINVIRTIPLDFDARELAGRTLAVTGSGSYFRNMQLNTETDLGIVRISRDSKSLELLWGFNEGGRPTSELAAHLMTHIERLKKDPNHRVVMHCHSTNTLAMTYIHDLDEIEFTKTLWRMCTECIVVFPDGVSVLPWMLCGTDEIGRATAKKMQDSRLVIWAQHGIFASGRTIDETFGLIETVEKAAEIYIKTLSSRIVNTISDEQLRLLADAFMVTPRDGYLK